MSNSFPLLMAEEYWKESMFSIARHFGQIDINGHQYIIVNKEGKDIFECSEEAEAAGREMAIEPGEPCDLVRSDLVPAYRKLGRDRIIELLKEGKGADEIKSAAKDRPGKAKPTKYKK